jgi:hypothetical protein
MLKPLKSCVNNTVGCGGTAAEAFQVFQIATLHISAGCGQKLGARIAASKTEHLVTCSDQFRDNPGAEEPCGPCDENTHRNLLSPFTTRIDEKQPPRLNRRQSPS